MNVLDRISQSDFVATEDDVENLARQVFQGEGSKGTYLKVLVRRCQDMLVKSRRNRLEQESVVNDAHAILYDAVLRGVSDDGCETKEAHRRAVFARTAASTLRVYWKGGGDIKRLNVAEVTKASLRVSAKPASIDKTFERARNSIMRAAKKLVKESPEDALALIEALQEQLDSLVHETTQEEDQPSARIVSTQGLHREARA